jgi:hypothetical protein
LEKMKGKRVSQGSKVLAENVNILVSILENMSTFMANWLSQLVVTESVVSILNWSLVYHVIARSVNAYRSRWVGNLVERKERNESIDLLLTCAIHRLNWRWWKCILRLLKFNNLIAQFEDFFSKLWITLNNNIRTKPPNRI